MNTIVLGVCGPAMPTAESGHRLSGGGKGVLPLAGSRLFFSFFFFFVFPFFFLTMLVSVGRARAFMSGLSHPGRSGTNHTV